VLQYHNTVRFLSIFFLLRNSEIDGPYYFSYFSLFTHLTKRIMQLDITRWHGFFLENCVLYRRTTHTSALRLEARLTLYFFICYKLRSTVKTLL
jgi:hypothetical protein